MPSTSEMSVVDASLVTLPPTSTRKGWRFPASSQTQADLDVSGLANRLRRKSAEDSYHLSQRDGTMEALKVLEALGQPLDWERHKSKQAQTVKLSTLNRQ